LHKLQRGPASRSYGVACARLAGVPEPVLVRARAILVELEQGSGPAGGPPSVRRGRPREARPQLDLFDGKGAPPSRHPAVDALRTVEVDRLTPLEALQLVANLKRMANDA
jgi:DNA mismatch repair protein MutS